MKTQKVEDLVTILDEKDFTEKYPRFTSFVQGEGKALFDLIMQPAVFLEARTLAQYGYPSVLAVAEKSYNFVHEHKISDDSSTKQFIGSVICALMEANGYKKTGTKKSVPHKFFTTGEYYEKDMHISRIDSLKRCGSDRLANLKAVDTSVTSSWKG